MSPISPGDGSSKSRPLGILTNASPDAQDWKQLILELYATQGYLVSAWSKINLLLSLLTRPVHVLAFSQTVTVTHVRALQITQSLGLKQSVAPLPRAVHTLQMHQVVTVVKVPAKILSQQLTVHQSLSVNKALGKQTTQQLVIHQSAKASK
jgi:hypothetical protein